jgi:predicted nucleic acid-binding protein
MVVVTGTSPINYLVLIDQIEILPLLYERILIPVAHLRQTSFRVSQAVLAGINRRRGF